MNYRLFAALAVACLVPITAGTANAEMPPISLTVTGDASPELLADFRQALNRAADRQPETQTDQTSPEPAQLAVDLDQFWKVDRDIAYTRTNNPRQQLDIIYPFEGEPPYRFIVNFHGGNWNSGSRDSALSAAMYWAVYEGYALVNVGYRFSNEAHWPAQLYDAKAAIRFLRAHADQYNLDGRNIVAWGSSAGGHLAQMLAATNDDPTMEDLTMGYAEASSAMQGVVSWSGVSDVTTLAPLGRSSADRLMGYPAYESRLAREASPIAHVTREFPPILLIHGTNNDVVPFEQSARMALKVNSVTGRAQSRLKLIINGRHSADTETARNVADSLDFVDGILFPEEPNPHRSAFFPPIQTLSGD